MKVVQAFESADDTVLQNRAVEGLSAVLLCFIDPRVRKIRNEASSCPGIFSRTLRFYYVVAPPVHPSPIFLTDTENW